MKDIKSKIPVSSFPSANGLVLTALSGYLALLILSAVFYRERTLFLDIPFHLFYIIKDNDFAIQNYRWAAFFTQLFPLLMTKIQLPLAWVLKGYSMAFPLLYFLVFVIVTFLWRDLRCALVGFMVPFLFGTHTFFWIQSELPQALAFMALTFGFIHQRMRTGSGNIGITEVVVITPLSLLVSFSHPLVIFPFTYWILFLLYNRENNRFVHLLSFAGAAFLGGVLLKNLFFKTPYESQAAGGLANFIRLFPDYFTIATNVRFLEKCGVWYQGLPALLIATSVYYIARRSWMNLLMYLSFFIGYLLLVNVSYPDGNSPDFYIENLYLPLSVVCGIPLMYHLFPEMSAPLRTGLIALIILLSVFRFVSVQPFYAQRLQALEQILAQYKNEKVIIRATPEHRQSLILTWATPYELWLLGMLKEGETATVMLSDHPEQYQWALGEKRMLITTWEFTGYNALPEPYFHFVDTVSSYKLIP